MYNLLLFGLSWGLAKATSVNWKMCPVKKSSPACITTKITSSPHQALLEAAMIPDPIIGTNDVNFRWIAETDWEWSTRERVGKVLKFLYLSGYPSEVYVGDVLVKKWTGGAFVPVTVDLGEFEGPVRIVVRSAVAAAAAAADAREVPERPPDVQHGFSGIEYLRIPQYLFGWDWGIATGAIGFDVKGDQHQLKPITLLVDTHIRDEGDWNMIVRWKPSEPSPHSVNVVLIDSRTDSVVFKIKEVICNKKFDHDRIGIEFSVPRASVSDWQVGRRDNVLYEIRVCLPVECMRRGDIGFRQTTLVPGAGQIQLNGKDLFLYGTNIVPTNPYSPSTNAEIDLLFQSILANPHINIIRIWGGGYYGSDYMYSLANQHGILVWEELKFACASYPFGDASFVGNVRDEIAYQIERIYSYPSFVILSGDNEVGQMLAQNWYNVQPPERLGELLETYTKKMIPFIRGEIEKIFLPDHSRAIFLPSSPDNKIDHHYYDYHSDCRDVNSFPVMKGIISEFGYQSYCDFDTCLARAMMVDEIDGVRNEKVYESKFLIHRQHRVNGMSELHAGISKIFDDVPHGGSKSRVEEFVWYTQIYQAVCLKSAIEFFSRNHPQSTTGLLYWQANDVWPSASWSTMDVYGNWKPAWYVTSSDWTIWRDRREGHDEIVVSTGDQQLSSGMLHVVSVLNHEVHSVAIEGYEVRVSTLSVCPSGACVAALSTTNYILIGTPNRANHKFDSVHEPVTVLRTADLNTIVVEARIPTPFIWIIGCANLKKNFFFLTPSVPEFSKVTVMDCHGDGNIRIRSFWSFASEDVGKRILPHQFLE